MTETPIESLPYDTPPPRRQGVVGPVAFALALACATVPVHMAWRLLSGRQDRWPVFKPYAAKIGSIDFGVNWPWFALDTLAILLGVVAVYAGRTWLGVIAATLGTFSMVVVMVIVLGSPW